MLYVLVKSKPNWVIQRSAKAAECMCVFGRSRKAEMLSRTRWHKTVITLLFYNILMQNLTGCFVNSCRNRLCDFYIFPIVGIGAIHFQSKKTHNAPLFQGVFSLLKKLKSYVISILINCTVWLTFLCRIWVSIVQGFPSRDFSKQRLAHSSVTAKTITSDISHVYTFDVRTIKEAPWLPKRTSPQHSQKHLEIKFVSGF